MRKLLLLTLVVFVGIAFIARLYYLQVHSSKNYNPLDDTAVRKVFTYPKRGYVYDRNGELLVANQPSYDVMVIPREVEEFDISEFCSLLKITEEKFHKTLEKAKNYSPRLPYVFLSNLAKDDYAVLQEKMRKYDGFYIQKRSIRTYRKTIGANVLGDIGEVNQAIINKDGYYGKGDLIGKQGVEKTYEKILRGIKGTKFIQKDRFNRDLGAFKGGKNDTIAQPGKDITITIDSKLQEYGELLMTNKRGGIVVIEPSSGEILAMVSGPTYNPNLLVGRERSKNFTKLYNDSLAQPLFDRGLQAMYPPGSPFKTINALIGLQEGVIDTNDTFRCSMGFNYGNRKMGCHAHRSPANMNLGIYESCNAYFANVYLKIMNKYDTPAKSMDTWSNHVKSFGLGNYLGNDLSVGQPGKIPAAITYDRAHGKGKWYPTFTLSNAIGQGEVLATPIQLANMAAAIGNRGYYYTPHIIKNIENDTIPSKYTTPNYTTIAKKHFEPVIQGMFDVYNKGTAEMLKVRGIDICGKTGTAENFAIIDSTKTQLTDHSIFIAFAPKDNPKIAIAVFIENGYFGSRFAGKMASLMIEKYLKNEITRTDLENFVLSHSLEHEYKKPYSGEPFKINRETTLETIPQEEFEALKYLKAKIDSK
ncbi:penicillin-binding protein 2 [Winogradskyella sp. PC-19]|uniref:penicillin-binding protein 2 n=1 Tax=unclassified Winogradskyella TaxID=2615021 RepID=UPI000B3D1C4D|nr:MULTISPECIES: penicillin-binding protein 2 [unclassified Winogradskyella]ARV10298.1 penicillin-binding protein 2 [Winogradskyella sp. PC-19]RZN81490.1 MAG: penicillin-binding protein 2 [Winogradskyella sp.]